MLFVSAFKKVYIFNYLPMRRGQVRRKRLCGLKNSSFNRAAKGG